MFVCVYIGAAMDCSTLLAFKASVCLRVCRYMRVCNHVCDVCIHRHGCGERLLYLMDSKPWCVCVYVGTCVYVGRWLCV